MRYLPLGLDVQGRHCLLLGTGAAACQRAELLRRAGAKLRLVAAEIPPALAELAYASGGECRQRHYCEEDLERVALAVGASGDEALNRRLAADAERRGVLVNIVDNAELCSAIFPAIVDRSPFVISITSGGVAPGLSRQLRAQIETWLPESWRALGDFAAELRGRVRQHLPEALARRRFWEWLVAGPAASMLAAGRHEDAAAAVEQVLTGGEGMSQTGEVFLVGAGPGDPDLLTLRAAQLLQCADIVLYDRLVPAVVLERARRDAERLCVGKAPNAHPVPQEQINELLIKHARAGRRVLRLKGGNPLIFGRGGEEIEQLAAAGIPFQIVPGISAAEGAACHAGIPLTHRDCADSVRFLSGHLRDGRCDMPWAQLLEPRQTLVFYMALGTLEEICRQLIAHGMAAERPAALVERATMPDQRVTAATLQTLPTQLSPTPSGPALLIVGEVVGKRHALAWRHQRAKES